MPMNLKIFDGTTMCMCSSGRIALSFLILAGVGVAIGVSMASSSGLSGKITDLLQKHRKKVAASCDTKEDRISQLPDDLLSIILSCLDLREALRTRILSRRWKNICKIRSQLHFDCSKMFKEVRHHHIGSSSHKLRFCKAVDQSLQFYSGQKIFSLALSSCLGVEFTSYFYRWMHSFATLGIQELLLDFCSPILVNEYGVYSSVDPFPLPLQPLLEADSLTELYLLKCLLRPISFKGQFNSLRSLTLVMVPLDNGEFPAILSSCVNLQQMSLSSCKLPPEVFVCGQCLQLRSMSIKLCAGVKEIDIHAGNLSLFYCYTDQKIKFVPHFVPKLEELCISFNGSGTVPYMFGEVARDCTRLKQLIFQTKTDELRYIASQMNTFGNLDVIYLSITVDSKADLLSVASLLDACPVLKQLRFSVRCLSRNEQRGGVWPARRHSHLKELEFEGFQGTRYEIEFASYLLRSASALERLFICSSYSTYSSDFKWTKHLGRLMDDEERQLIYKELVGQPISGKVEVVMS